MGRDNDGPDLLNLAEVMSNGQTEIESKRTRLGDIVR